LFSGQLRGLQVVQGGGGGANINKITKQAFDEREKMMRFHRKKWSQKQTTASAVSVSDFWFISWRANPALHSGTTTPEVYK
jgi:hypothetical protein